MTLILYSEVGTLLVATELRGEREVFRFGSWPLPGLTRQVAVIFANAVASDGWVASMGSAAGLHFAARRFVYHLASAVPNAESLRIGTLKPAHLDGFDDALHERYPDSATGHAVLRLVVRMLREADERAEEGRDYEADSDEPVPSLSCATLAAETRRRARWASRFRDPGTRPLDAFSPAVAQQLRDAADQDIEDVVRRIVIQGARLVADGRCPDSARDVAAHECDIAWLIHAEGPISKKGAMRLFAHGEIFRVESLNRLVFPTARDLVPFLIRIGLDAGIPIECLGKLSADCLRNADRGRVTIRYLKRRGKGNRWQTKVVRDGHPMSPGGLVRTVLTLTARARELTGSQRLWVGIMRSGELGEVPIKAHAFREFINDHDLRDGGAVPLDGEPPLVASDLRRLRKTYKVERIRATRGRVRDWADDHSVGVAVNRYGKVPELDGEHDAAVEAALAEALAVSSGEVGGAATAEPAPDGERVHDDVSPTRVEPGLTSVPGVDLWVATCRDPYDSPHGRTGQLCPVAFFGCLRCGNATVHLGKLPAIMQYLDHLVGQRERMSAEDWAAVHRDSHNRIVAHILPLFSEADAAKARAVAQSSRRLVFLPPGPVEDRAHMIIESRGTGAPAQVRPDLPVSARFPADHRVLTGWPRRHAGPDPLFGELRWDLTAAIVTPNIHSTFRKVNFEPIADPVRQITAREFIAARLCQPEALKRCMSPAGAYQQLVRLTRFNQFLDQEHDGCSYRDVDQAVLDHYVRWIRQGVTGRRGPGG